MKTEKILPALVLFTPAAAQWRPDLHAAVDKNIEFSDVVLWGCVIGALLFVGCCATFCIFTLCKKKPEPYMARHQHALTGTVSDHSLTTFQTFRKPPPTYEEAISSLELT